MGVVVFMFMLVVCVDRMVVMSSLKGVLNMSLVWVLG